MRSQVRGPLRGFGRDNGGREAGEWPGWKSGPLCVNGSIAPYENLALLYGQCYLRHCAGSKNCAGALGSADIEPQTYGHPGSDERVVRPTRPLSDGWFDGGEGHEGSSVATYRGGSANRIGARRDVFHSGGSIGECGRSRAIFCLRIPLPERKSAVRIHVWGGE